MTVFATTALAAQEKPPTLRRNGVDLELLGNGVLVSLNYDRLVTPNVILRVGESSWEIGCLFFCDTDEKSKFDGVPVSIAHLRGKGPGYLEAGVGFLIGRYTRILDPGSDTETRTSSTVVDLTGILGYRHQSIGSRVYWRFVFTPFVSLVDAGEGAPAQGVLPSVGLSFGVRF